ncbi:MAG: hypothetical protein ABW044_05340 [Cellvibrio sp.]
MQEVISIPRPRTNFSLNLEITNKRRAVRYQAEELFAGRPTKIFYKGNAYTFDDVVAETAVHPKFAATLKALYAGDSMPLKDLMRQVAQFAICEYLFEGEQESLGFIS